MQKVIYADLAVRSEAVTSCFHQEKDVRIERGIGEFEANTKYSEIWFTE